jgi:hypothetical protein
MVIGLTQEVEQTPAWFRRHQSRVLVFEPEKAAVSEESASTRDDGQSTRSFVYLTPKVKVKTQSRMFNTI